jgi:hypothetical protein
MLHQYMNLPDMISAGCIGQAGLPGEDFATGRGYGQVFQKPALFYSQSGTYHMTVAASCELWGVLASKVSGTCTPYI